MRGKITKRSVDALKPGAGGAEEVLWDAELKGFGIRCNAAAARATCSTTAPAPAAALLCAS
jgi:hypothetical protein